MPRFSQSTRIQLPISSHTLSPYHIPSLLSFYSQELTSRQNFKSGMAPKNEVGTSRNSPPERRPNLKRKRVDDVYDLDDPAANLLTAAEIMVKKFAKNSEAIEDVKALALERMDLLEKKSIKLVKAKRKIEGLKLMLSRKYANDQQKMTMMKEEMVAKMKRDTDIAILESKIQMATDAVEHGFKETWIWPVVAWKEELDYIKSEDPDLSAPKGKGPASSSGTRRSKFVSSSDEDSGDESEKVGGKAPKKEDPET